MSGTRIEIRLSLSGEAPEEPQLRRLSGVGLLRGEFLFRDREVYATDPKALAGLADYVRRTCRAFAGKPIWYRLTDLWSDEANTLAGNPHPLEESNPIVGLRGIRRSLAFPDEAAVEIETVARVARDHPDLHLLTPFVQDGDEMSEAVALCRRAGWPNRIGSMIEIPSAIFAAADLARAGASNLMVGLNDLTGLFFGRDRGPPEVKLKPELWRALALLKQGAGAAEWGVAGSLSREIVERARTAGAEYVSIHYSELPAVLGDQWSHLPELDHVRRVKQKTKAAKAASRRN